MSTIDEKQRAIESVNEFLVDLLYRAKTPRVPMAIRVRAQRLLRHLPTKHDINEPAKPFRFKPEVYRAITGRDRDAD